MKKLYAALIVLLFFSLMSSIGPDDPFGLRPGMSLAEIRKICGDLEHHEEDLYYTTSPPRGYPIFQMYALEIDKRKGLYTIFAGTGGIETEISGKQFMSEYRNMVMVFTYTYGEPDTKINKLIPGGKWDKPSAFMTSILENERTVQTSWERNLPKGIKKITIRAFASSLTMGFITIKFEY